MVAAVYRVGGPGHELGCEGIGVWPGGAVQECGEVDRQRDRRGAAP